MDLLNNRDGLALALGICNGFQALIKLGLVQVKIVEPNAKSPTHKRIIGVILRLLIQELLLIYAWFNNVHE